MLWQLSSKHGTTIEYVLYFLHFWNFSSNCKTFEMLSRLIAILDAISIDTISNACTFSINWKSWRYFISRFAVYEAWIGLTQFIYMSLIYVALYKDTEFAKNKTRQQLSTKTCFYKILDNKILRLTPHEFETYYWK